MKIPKYIEKAIRDTAKASAIAYKNSEIVRNWLENHPKYEELNDTFIDCCEYGNNIPEVFIERLKEVEK